MFDLVPRMMEIARQEAENNARPKERCGVIVKDGDNARLLECANVAENPHDFFRIDPQEWAHLTVDYEIMAIWHTHPNGDAAPSASDRKMIEVTGVPWHIVSWPQGGHSYTEPTGYVTPYEGRQFVHGVMDCYSLIRDWYKGEFGIDLIDESRNENWWLKGGNLYLEGFERNGFIAQRYDVKNLERGDVILMQMHSHVPNHGGIYLGDGKLLHHVQDHVSRVTTYGGMWLKNTTHFLRHESRCRAK